jgi:hypothetical protein
MAFHVFEFQRYYPAGGLGDYVGSAETVEDAAAVVASRKRQKRGRVTADGWGFEIVTEREGRLVSVSVRGEILDDPRAPSAVGS